MFRNRLQSKRMKREEAAAPTASPPISKGQSANQSTPSSKTKGKKKATPMKASPEPVVVVEEEPVQPIPVTLAPLAKSEKKRNLKEVVGGAGAFFGVPGSDIPPAAETSTPNKSRNTSKLNDVTSSSKRVKRERDDAPPSAPTSADQCLEGLKIAVTGVMEITGREDLESRILELGGKVASNVSGKTDMLVAGEVLEDGRPAKESSKYKNALEKGVRVLNEEEFLKFIEEKKQSAMKVTSSLPSLNPMIQSKQQPFKISTATAVSTKPKETVIHKVNEVDRESMLWVDKYRPESLTDIIGSADIVRKLRDWLKDWEVVHVKKALKVNFSKENPGAKAVLLSGPPGTHTDHRFKVISQ